MDKQSTLRISVSISISPATHSYIKSEAPKLNLTITSHHSESITIYADDLSPSLMLACGAFTITSVTSDCEIKQSIKSNCRIPPPSKIIVSLKEHLFYTLYPNSPLTLSAPFSRNRKETDGRPLAKSDPDYASDRTAKFGVCGVDGLEPGNDYVLSLASIPHIQWNTVRWWEYGTKEQVLHPQGNEGTLDGRKVEFGRGPHEAIVIDTTNIEAVLFQCRE